MEHRRQLFIGSGGVGGGGGVPSDAAGLASYRSDMGKGLSELCPPYREAYVFGARLNTPNADGWNCVPEIMEPTSTFDLSRITPGREVVVVLLVGFYISSAVPVEHRWYRGRDNASLFTYRHSIPDPAQYGYGYWEWYYVYSFIGYVPWEIWENGNHYMKIATPGYSRRLDFNISGFSPPETEREILLAPGESQAVSFKVYPCRKKPYYVAVNGLRGSFIAR